MKTLSKLLIANRGEISVRIQRTARAMGLATVAVYSDADREAPHVRAADEAVHLGAAPSAESYLSIDKLLAAARRTGADAVHPGYGFLAENAGFAEACAAAGLTFVGPRPAAIRAMGSKQHAKALVAAAGVPVVPGYDGAEQGVAQLEARALSLGFPLLLKASAGGGGKGMRIVRGPEGLTAAIEAAKREALGAFGDDTLLIERYVERPRHVEIQILGDEHGQLVHLFERECSIQRRHQKLVEESPSPALDEALRARMGEAALAVGRAVDYSSAGTVEFILGPDGAFYFLEVNTRLQVEHAVTEGITGLDLVREQLRIARGEPLGYTQADLRLRGAALEVRLCAEDPAAGFLPASGRILRFSVPTAEGLRVDSGVESGSEVSIYYDSMLAKLITTAPTRLEAIQRMQRALRELTVDGIKTNRALLARVLAHEEFQRGATHTHFIEDHLGGALAEDPPAEPDVQAAALAVALGGQAQRRQARRALPALEPGYRNNPVQPQWLELALGARTLRVDYRALGHGRFDASVDGHHVQAQLLQVDADGVSLELDGLRLRRRVTQDGTTHYVTGPNGQLSLVEQPRFPSPRTEATAGACVAPMPGKIVLVHVEPGRRVEAGEVLVVMEAMKMEHTVKASAAGTVARVAVAVGDQVDTDALLVVVEPEPS